MSFLRHTFFSAFLHVPAYWTYSLDSGSNVSTETVDISQENAAGKHLANFKKRKPLGCQMKRTIATTSPLVFKNLVSTLSLRAIDRSQLTLIEM